jgi:hypothetical protein
VSGNAHGIIAAVLSFARLLGWGYNPRTCYSVVDGRAGNVISSAIPVFFLAGRARFCKPRLFLSSQAERLRRGFNGYSMLPRSSRGFIF